MYRPSCLYSTQRARKGLSFDIPFTETQRRKKNTIFCCSIVWLWICWNLGDYSYCSKYKFAVFVEIIIHIDTITMSDGVKSEISSDIDQNYALNTADPKNVQELTIYVSRDYFWETECDEQFCNFSHFFRHNLGANFIAKCAGQIPIDVRSSNFTYRRYVQSYWWFREKHRWSYDTSWSWSSNRQRAIIETNDSIKSHPIKL